MLWRAILAFLALPGVIAFAVPLLLFRTDRQPFSWWSLLALVPGMVLLLWCVREFYVAGRGTLAPWSPPRQLVTSGPYRYSRNPMYVAVALILLGWAIGFRSWSLTLYGLAVTVAFQLRIVLGEEPWLERSHGDAWRHYRSSTPRWLGRPGEA
jgi:protein-S-isoprenylcysteine O-methyltransferase Ste14